MDGRPESDEGRDAGTDPLVLDGGGELGSDPRRRSRGDEREKERSKGGDSHVDLLLNEKQLNLWAYSSGPIARVDFFQVSESNVNAVLYVQEVLTHFI